MTTCSTCKHATATILFSLALCIGLAMSMATSAANAAADELCVCEPVCGAEPTCGLEPACGVEPGCGSEPILCQCDQPTCGGEMPCESGCDGSCDGGCDGRGKPTLMDRWKHKSASMRRHMSKLLGVDHQSQSCDDGCDSYLIEELSAPVHHHVTPTPIHETMVPQSTIPFSTQTSPLPRPIVRAPSPPRSNVRSRIDTGVVVPSRQSQSFQDAPGAMPLRDVSPSSRPLPNDAGMPDSMDLEGKSSTNPFLDDEASLNRPVRIHRTSYRFNQRTN